MTVKFHSGLGALADPHFYTEPVNIPREHFKNAVRILRAMMLIRRTEQAIASLVEKKQVKCPCHLAIGQEAIAVGVAESLRKSDRIFSTHRAHAHYLASGGDLYSLLAEVLGRATGCSKGQGGSMHLISEATGFKGSLPIVGGTIPLALGAALAAKMDGHQDIAICFFGDGASEEGILHESLNFAATHEIPVLFVCENNLYSSHLDIQLRQPSDRISRFADSHHVINEVVDGNDVFAVQASAHRLIQQARSSNCPIFLEAVTYRWLGHVGPSEDLDVGVRRSQKNLNAWKARDPIQRLKTALVQNAIATSHDFDALETDLDQYIDKTLASACEAPYPTNDQLFMNVYHEK